MSLTAKDIRRVSRRTVEALRDIGYECYLFGSAACHLWGMDYRVPDASNIFSQDIDIVVLTDDDPEEIKAKLEEHGSRFYLVLRKRYKVLYYALRWRPRIRCKVDIVTPKTRRINAPDIPRDLTLFMGDIPVIPFLPLVLLKLLGWHSRHTTDKPHLQRKISRDETDIRALLRMLNVDDTLHDNPWLRTTKPWLVRSARVHVKAFAEKFPSTIESWRSIGFRIRLH
ncbi:hypothetical protein AMATHDRAFT_49288 [Amanita thiersii Skay4041]|uniref:Uncharacterized protein n=1 Tax=Amanita thiersii Skay4041 TaxID=703135 RepID=A0A2A9NHC8_9AGAR|nr:hypothetical protein AMATHDRAFT_49288 [Amanita thiersii Skay4041]